MAKYLFVAAASVSRVLFCSGKMAYDLAKLRSEREGGAIKTAVVRIEVLFLGFIRACWQSMQCLSVTVVSAAHVLMIGLRM